MAHSQLLTPANDVRQIAERMAREVGIPAFDSSKYFECSDAMSYTIQLAPLPYGPIVDEEGRPVECVPNFSVLILFLG